MFQSRQPRGMFQAALAFAELVYYKTVFDIRKTNRNALFSLLQVISQTVLMVAGLYAMMWILGVKQGGIRGDYALYLLSGVFLYMVHITVISRVAGAGSATNPLRLHPPLTPAVSICSAILSALYLNVLSITIVLYVYNAGWGPIEIENWIGALGMLILSLFIGVGVGLIFLALTPWMPGLSPTLRVLYIRVNMIASGKMFVANNMPQKMRDMFDWNPLYHTIDQARGFLFVNYTPMYSSWLYALWVGLALLVIGLMGEFFTRQKVSVSWGARG